MAIKLKVKVMDVVNSGASWGDEMRVTIEGVDENSDPMKVAELVNQATYELITGDDTEATGKIVRAAGTASHGIAWLDEDSGDCVFEWHVA